MRISPRLRRLFHPISGRCIDVAVDHGLFGGPAFLPAIEDMPAVVERLVAAAPDAILQMWAAFLAERAGALDGRFGCATPQEALTAHRLAESALRSQRSGAAEPLAVS